MAITVQNAFQYAVDRWLDYDHPRIETGHCLALKLPKDPCTVCSDICPSGSITAPRKIDWTICLDCNLCASACPSRCIRSSADLMSRFVGAIDTGANEVTFGCEANGGAALLRPYCLGSIPWEVWAAVALDHHILCDITKCKECVEREGRAQLLATLEQTARFLGKKVFTERIHLDTQLEDGSGLSRREAFSFARVVASNVAENALVKDQNTPVDGMFFRKYLKERVTSRERDDPRKYGLMGLSLTDTCWACNVCKNACPSRAITIEHDEEAREYYVVVDPMLCTGCMLCKTVCRDNGIAEVFEFRTDSPLTPLANRANPSVCTECGRNFKPNGETRCLRCIKAEERKIKEQENERKRKERLEKLKQEREAREAEKAREAEEQAKAANGSAGVAEATVGVPAEAGSTGIVQPGTDASVLDSLDAVSGSAPGGSPMPGPSNQG